MRQVDDAQPRAEAQAQVSEGSAGEFALAWLHAVLVMHRWDLAMQTATIAFRFRSATRWLAPTIAARRLHPDDQEDVVAAFLALGTAHHLWHAYASSCVREHTDRFAGCHEHLAIGGRPRPLTVDREEFLVVDYRTVPGPDDHGVKLLEAPMDPLWSLVVKHLQSGYLMDASYPSPCS
ncbi:MAG TPA: hypothetical protein VGK35_15500 [Actinotalea sp.]